MLQMDYLQWYLNQNTNILLKKMDFKMLNAKCWPLCFGINVLKISLVFLWSAYITINKPSSPPGDEMLWALENYNINLSPESTVYDMHLS